MSIKKSGSVPAGGSYRQFGYTSPNSAQKKSKKTEAPSEEDENGGMASAISSIAGARSHINSNIPQVPTSGNAGVSDSKISAVNTGAAKKAVNAVQAYENNQYNPQKFALEEDLDKLVKQLIPDLGVKFKTQDNGQIIAVVINSAAGEVVREFPAEKMFDIIHSMSQKLGTVAKRKL